MAHSRLKFNKVHVDLYDKVVIIFASEQFDVAFVRKETLIDSRSPFFRQSDNMREEDESGVHGWTCAPRITNHRGRDKVFEYQHERFHPKFG